MAKQKAQYQSSVLVEGRQQSFKQKFVRAMRRDWQLYLLCVPALLFIFVFNYGPMYGLQIAFKDFSAKQGIWGSEWVGFDNFIRFFKTPQFLTLLKNTLGISIYSLIAGFPFPIILALILNQVRSGKLRKVVQMVVYAPHFISVVVLCGMLYVFMSPSTGILNNILASLGLERVFFLGEPSYFPHIFVWSDIWQNTGWGMIIYLAALSSISPELYEAAKIDGASKLKTIWYVDIPGILPQIVILFIMRTGSFMNVGFQKAFLLQTPLNLETSEIISTYVYKVGLLNAQFSYSTAIDLFNTVVNVVLILMVNAICKKVNDTSLW